MRVTDLIEIKKRGNELSEEQIRFLIGSYIKGEIKDYQMSAFLMSVYFQGMTSKETSVLTEEMMHSGDVIDLKAIKGIKVDKHSTGGIGDKVSLVVGPLVAALGIPMAKMSGRGLGFTGGTIDKLESIPGFKVHLTIEEFIKQVNDIKLAIIAQTDNLVPADKLLYALRDVTATVDAIPLIASSIMSKKLATGSDAILLDVKVGDGAFMKTVKQAKELATEMIGIGKHLNRDVRVEITSMDKPLGRAIGNKNEVLEAIETLKGNGEKYFVELITSAVVEIALMSKQYSDKKVIENKMNEVIKNGEAVNKFYEWIEYQGGDIKELKNPKFWNPKNSFEVKSKEDGFYIEKSAVDFGLVAMKLGAGRETKEDSIDNEAGILLNKKTNDKVQKGDLLFTLYSSNPIEQSLIKELEKAYSIESKQEDYKVIIDKL